tara:strand:- start:2846 stop:3109 length:264 start_codon:yes stop_codon:yes gene_type:complete
MSSTTPTLNFDMISKILNIRMNEKKNDRYKNIYQNNFNSVVKDLNTAFENNPYSVESWYDDLKDVIFDLNYEHQRPYMPWEVQGSGY